MESTGWAKFRHCRSLRSSFVMVRNSMRSCRRMSSSCSLMNANSKWDNSRGGGVGALSRIRVVTVSTRMGVGGGSAMRLNKG